ncbi:MAG: family 1 glycosylhydrolase [Prochloraceae cyanobacterium]|nr:family 1 glycosylhydrolase [Prochloraceae cyanobacterium]
MSFPKDFVWGAADASYQVEGAAYEDDKGLSVWDVMCREPGRIWSGHVGDVACDRYHRYQEDVGIMAEIGLMAYRLSISWPRVIPDGIGKINQKGLEFYDKLIDLLWERDIEPWVTLFHWDYPYALYCRGGWLNRDSANWFADYVSVIVNKFSDRVSHWIIQNEPQCFIGLGHQTGEHAPGLKLSFAEVLLAAHHSLLAHGFGMQVLRSRAKTQPTVGTALVGIVKIPASNSLEDIEAARTRMFSIAEKNCWNNTWFSDPILFGQYPSDGLKLFEEEMPKIHDGDMKNICQPLDFYGVNIYVRFVG